MTLFDNNIAYLIMNVAKKLRHQLNIELESYGITAAQWAVIKQIELGVDEKKTSVAIGSTLGFDKPTMSGIVTRLEDKGWLIKAKHPTDKRAAILLLTEKAQVNISLLEEVSTKVSNKFLSPYTADEKALLLTLLQKQIEQEI